MNQLFGLEGLEGRTFLRHRVLIRETEGLKGRTFMRHMVFLDESLLKRKFRRSCCFSALDFGDFEENFDDFEVEFGDFEVDFDGDYKVPMLQILPLVLKW